MKNELNIIRKNATTMLISKKVTKISAIVLSLVHFEPLHSFVPSTARRSTLTIIITPRIDDIRFSDAGA